MAEICLDFEKHKTKIPDFYLGTTETKTNSENVIKFRFLMQRNSVSKRYPIVLTRHFKSTEYNAIICKRK